MQKRRVWGYLLLAVLIAVNGSVSTAFATTSNSPHYKVTETEFGSSSTHQNCSTQYCAKASIGDMGAGDSANGTTTAKFGSVAQGEPLLEVIVDPGVSNLGDLSTETTATKTMVVRVRNYLSGGYTMQIVGDPPKYNGHSLGTPTSPTAAHVGTEQFAINAAANTLPSIGAAPVQVPSDQTSFGVVEDDYKTPNLFKYVNGDTVARSQSASGQTNYTISMIVNISNMTPAGHYAGDFSAVVVPVY